MNACVLTGDIAGFTSLAAEARKQLLGETHDMLRIWAGDVSRAGVFRGDSFQVVFMDIGTSMRRAIQLRCWLKMHSLPGAPMLDARMVIGVGAVSYYGSSVLDSDGEAFHLSGRAFDKLKPEENLKIRTSDKEMNAQLDIILGLAEEIMGNWTVNQAEVIYYLLENKTQQQMAEELDIAQSSVNNRIKLSRWKQIEKMNAYIVSLIGSNDAQ